MRILVNGLKINYKVMGEGRPLLILHGWGSNSDKWQRVGELLTEKNLKVIIPDLPGFGKSEEPPRAWGLDDYCDFVEKLARSLNLEKFYLLGHSFGGALVVKYCLKFPEKIDKLFLVAASCIRTRNFKKKLLYIVSKIFKIFSFSQFLRKAFYRFIVGKSDYLYTKGVMRDTYLKIIAEDLSSILSQIQAPTVIIWGERDDVTPLSDAQKIVSKIRNSELEIIPAANHDLNIKFPEKIADVILNVVKDPVILI